MKCHQIKRFNSLISHRNYKQTRTFRNFLWMARNLQLLTHPKNCVDAVFLRFSLVLSALLHKVCCWYCWCIFIFFRLLNGKLVHYAATVEAKPKYMEIKFTDFDNTKKKKYTNNNNNIKKQWIVFFISDIMLCIHRYHFFSFVHIRWIIVSKINSVSIFIWCCCCRPTVYQRAFPIH